MSPFEKPSAESSRWLNLNPNIVIAGFVSLFTDLSSQMIVPILPLFLTETLGAPIWIVGLIEGLGAAVAGVLRVFAGWISDRFGHKKRLMLLGYGISNLSKPFFGAAANWSEVLGIRLVDRVGKGTRSAPRDALLAELTTSQDRGRAFGFRRAMDDLGAAIGPLAAALVLAMSAQNMRLVFALTIVPGVLAMVMLGLLKEPVRSQDVPVKRAMPQLSLVGFSRPYYLFLVVGALVAMANFSEAFLVLRDRSLGLSPLLIPIAYFVTNIVSSVLSMPAGILADRLGRKGMLAIGYVLLAVVDLGFALANQTIWIWLLMAGYGMFGAFTKGNEKVFIADLSQEHHRGTAMGTFNAVVGLAALPASLLAGFLWQTWGPQAPFIFSAGLMSLVLIVMVGVFPKILHGNT